MTAKWTGLPDSVARAFIRAPAVTSSLLWVSLLGRQLVVNHTLSLSDALQWGLLTLIIGLPLTYFAIGILGTLAYRFLSRRGQVGLKGYSLAGAVIGGSLGAALFPFLDPLGFGIVGMILGLANGIVVHIFTRSAREAAA